MAAKCPRCENSLRNTIRNHRGEIWCRRCHKQLVKRNGNGSVSFWMPPLKVDKNGLRSLQ